MSEAPRPDRPALEVDDLGFSYGDRFALADITFEVAPGTFTALLGPNGAGKTTLFALITHLFESREGAVRICGHDLRAETGRALAHLGVVFQQPTLDLDLTVDQNLRYFAALHGIARHEADAHIAVELERLEIVGHRNDRVRKLSGGMRRRVEVARSLLHRPSLLLLDEPTVGLDVPTRKRIVEHAHALAHSDGIAVLWATHLIDEIWPEDQVVVLHKGRIGAKGPVDAVVDAAGCESIGDAFGKLIAGAGNAERAA